MKRPRSLLRLSLLARKVPGTNVSSFKSAVWPTDSWRYYGAVALIVWVTILEYCIRYQNIPEKSTRCCDSFFYGYHGVPAKLTLLLMYISSLFLTLLCSLISCLGYYWGIPTPRVLSYTRQWLSHFLLSNVFPQTLILFYLFRFLHTCIPNDDTFDYSISDNFQ